MPSIKQSTSIQGLAIVELDIFEDDRGRFSEIFRKEWFPQRDWEVIQSNRSESEAGVLRGLHYHHKQVDYWHVTHGAIRAGLVDLRKHSQTYGTSLTLDLDHNKRIGLFIPVGVAHGFLSLTRATLIYIVDRYYYGSDEFGVAWNDPEINLEWGVKSPILSNRDRQNPRWKDISDGDLPG